MALPRGDPGCGSSRALPSRRSLRFSRTLLHLWDRHEINGALASVPVRGRDQKQTSMVILLSPESCVPQAHPIRHVNAIADEVLRSISPIFDEMYSTVGRPSIPPERLLKASVLMALYSVRSERLFCEQLATTFSGSRDSQRHDVRSAASCEAGR